MIDNKPYQYASTFPTDLNELIERFNIEDVSTEIEKVAHSFYIPSPITNSGKKSKKNVIIRTANHPWEILSVSSLSKLYPPQETEVFFYMPKGYAYENISDSPYELTIKSSVSELLDALREINPEKIYVQLSPHTKSEFLIIPLVHYFFEAQIVAEFYDMGFLFSDSIQRSTRQYTEQDIYHSHLSSWVALNYCDVVIVKAGGKSWEEFTSKCPAHCFSLYPMLDNPENVREISSTITPPSTDKIKIIFSGSVTSSEILYGPEISPGANFLEYFKEISEIKNAELNIYNAAQKTDSIKDDKFQTLQEWLRQLGDNVNYSSSIPQKELLDIQKQQSLGFFCVHYENDKVEHVGRIAIPNRAMSYLCSNLPIIVDSRAEFMAELIENFNAGIIVDPAQPRHLTQQLHGADINALKMGAKKLKEHLLKVNQKNLLDIINIVS